MNRTHLVPAPIVERPPEDAGVGDLVHDLSDGRAKVLTGTGWLTVSAYVGEAYDVCKDPRFRRCLERQLDREEAAQRGGPREPDLELDAEASERLRRLLSRAPVE
jgi:hypothetical protein